MARTWRLDALRSLDVWRCVSGNGHSLDLSFPLQSHPEKVGGIDG